MKNYFFVLLFSVSLIFQSCGSYQATPVSVEPVSKSFEIEKTKDDLYVSANNWMAETFNDAKSVIQFTDKEAGVVTGKYLLKPLYTVQGYSVVETGNGIYAIVKVQVKDGASKITVIPDDFTELKGDFVNPLMKFSKEDAITAMTTLMTSYENYLKNDSSTDW